MAKSKPREEGQKKKKREKHHAFTLKNKIFVVAGLQSSLT